ncbi:MAG: peptide chain release factor N(5)-glutamine methyltransferase [Deltaproteobacteria bacterium]|nr:MAG: peptide chain release factor N(5)-glutamine methyltransferase [Deltaproteobacteria bacterium]
MNLTNIPLTIKDILASSTQYLKNKDIDNPRLTAEILLSFVLGVERQTLYINYHKKLDKEVIQNYCSLIQRRIRGEPIQYIIGKKEFWALEFDVSPSVLIPRPETEILVEHAIMAIKDTKGAHILDLGTGSGVIAITMAKELPDAKIWALDISMEAIGVAIHNAKKHGVLNSIRFIRGDLWEPLRCMDLQFHLIVTNPPYIPREDYEQLPKEIKDWEPRIALNGGAGGLSLIKRIIKEAANFLLPNGSIFIEMSPQQVNSAIELLKKTNRFHSVEGITDYSHQLRIVKACRI